MTELNMNHTVHIFFTLIISCTNDELTYFILPQYNSFYGQHITEGVKEFYQIQNSTPWHSVQSLVEDHTKSTILYVTSLHFFIS